MRRSLVITQTIFLLVVFTLSGIFLFKNFIDKNPIALTSESVLGSEDSRNKNAVEKSINLDLKPSSQNTNYFLNNVEYKNLDYPFFLESNLSIVQTLNKQDSVGFETIYSCENNVVSSQFFENGNFFYIEKVDPFGDQRLILTNIKSKADPTVINLEPTSNQVYLDLYFDNSSKVLWLISVDREGQTILKFINTKLEVQQFTQIQNIDKLEFAGKTMDSIVLRSEDKCYYVSEETKVLTENQCINKQNREVEFVVNSQEKKLEVYELSIERKFEIAYIEPTVLSVNTLDSKMYIHLQKEMIVLDLSSGDFQRFQFSIPTITQEYVPIKINNQILFLNTKLGNLFEDNKGILTLIEGQKTTLAGSSSYRTMNNLEILILGNKRLNK